MVAETMLINSILDHLESLLWQDTTNVLRLISATIAECERFPQYGALVNLEHRAQE
jgi:hypothetical protein